MKNLKRVLSLVLATVMVIGMMVVGASAADYKDADKIDYAEAVEVMSAVGMIEGYDGNFAPEATIDRAGATKLITYLMLGSDVAKKLTVTEAPFEDVPANAWYAPFVAFCADKGLLEGYNNKFYPDGTIDAYGFAKLLLGALGYDAAIEGMTGDTWQVNVATLAIKNDLFNGNPDAFGNADLTRQQACLYAFNALKATTVEYEQKGTSITIGGAVINTGASKAIPVKTSDNVEGYDGVTDGKVQLCEKLYGSLKKDTKTTKAIADNFDRPGYTWYFDDKPVTFVGKAPYATYAAADFTAKTVEALSKKGYTISANDDISFNGDKTQFDIQDIYSKNVEGNRVAITRNGWNIEVYADSDKKLTVVATEAMFSRIDSVTTKNDTTTVKIDVYDAGTGEGNAKAVTITSKAHEDIYDLVKGYEKDDVFMGFYHSGWTASTAPVDALLAVDDNIETVSGKVTATSLDGGMNGWIKVDGAKYTMAWNYTDDATNLVVKAEGTFYLYNGFIVRYEQTKAADATNNFAYVLGLREEADKWDSHDKTLFAKLLLADATIVEVEYKNAADVTVSAGWVVNYTVEDDVYTLQGANAQQIGDNGAISLNSGVSELASSVYATDKTVFVIAENKDGKFDTAKAYVGVKNVPSVKLTNASAKHANGIATFVFGVYGSALETDTSDLIYVAVDKSAKITDLDLGAYYNATAVIDGEVTEIMVRDTVADAQNFANGLFKSFKINDKGIYTALTAATKVSNNIGDYYDADGFVPAKDGVVGLTKNEATTYMTYVENVPVFVDDKGDVTPGSVTDEIEGAAVIYTAKDNVITSIYLVVAE